MAACGAVEEQHGRTAESRQNNIHKTVVVDVAEGRAARGNGSSHAGIGAFEMTIIIQREQRQFLVSQRSVDLLDVVEYVALGDEKILPAVVVEIFQAHAPAGTARGKCAKTGLQALIGESPCAVVVIQAVEFARQNGHDYIGAAIVVEEILLHAVVRNKNIGEAVAIIIGERNAESSSLLC